MDNQKNQEPQGMQLTGSPEQFKGVYSNLALVASTPEEFIIDFYSALPNSPANQLLSRTIISPGHAKRLLGSLDGNLKVYEEKYGPIKIVPDVEARSKKLLESFNKGGNNSK